MAKVFAMGFIYPWESRSGIGHVGATLGGVNYESRGSAGVLKGSRARGATHPLFKHHFHIVLTNAQAARAKKFADAQVGKPYGWGAVGPSSYDCSGFMAAILNAAYGKNPHRRLFGTGTWTSVYKALGFSPGLGPTPSKGLTVAQIDRILDALGKLDDRVSHLDAHLHQVTDRVDAVDRWCRELLTRLPSTATPELRKQVRRILEAVQYPSDKYDGSHTPVEDGVDGGRLPIARTAEQVDQLVVGLANLTEEFERATGRSAGNRQNAPAG